MEMINIEMENEVWKPLPEVSFVEISSLGDVRTLDRVVSNGKGMYVIKGRILKQRRNRDGYLYVHFKVNGKQVIRSVHRLVAQAFIPNPDNLPEVNHKDNNPLNNNVSNLDWCTPEYNIAYREKYGKAQSFPVYAVNLKTWETQRFESQHEASRELGIEPSHINDVLKSRRKTAGGYWFVNDDDNAIKAAKSKFGDTVAAKVERLIGEKKTT